MRRDFTPKQLPALAGNPPRKKTDSCDKQWKRITSTTLM